MQAEWIDVFNYIIDSFFWFDIVVNFRTAFVEHGELYTDTESTRHHYLTSWFLPDIISVLPCELFFTQGKATRKSFKLTKLQKTPKLLRVGKLLKYARPSCDMPCHDCGGSHFRVHVGSRAS